ncbi:hypothetical protein DFH28DRAFT_979064 [Melampsora americana]|nr:hypothetical protein DFH28DRAFT_979064 [Melampsora americana]
MKLISLYTLIHLLSQSGSHLFGVDGMTVGTIKREAPFTASSSRQVVQQHNHRVGPRTEISRISIKEATAGNKYPKASNKSRIEVAQNFWTTFHMDSHEGFCGQHYNRYFAGDINEVLHSDYKDWPEKLIKIFKDTEDDLPTQIVFFQVLRHLTKSYKIPFITVQMIWRQLQTVLGKEDDLSDLFHDWQNEARITLRAYGLKMIEHIGSLTTEKELVDFVNTQREMGPDGLCLAGDWSPGDQKALFEFWVSNHIHYPMFKRNTKLQLWVEAQIVQTRLIQELRRVPLDLISEPTSGMKLAQSKLAIYSDIILHCHKSLEDDDYMPFFRSQVNINPYGLEIDRSLSPEDNMDILQFWSRHVHVFLRMNKLGETPSLASAIGTLVKKNSGETSRIMKHFLQEDTNNSIQKGPVLARFLGYFANNTRSSKNKQIARKALKSYQYDHQRQMSFTYNHML